MFVYLRKAPKDIHPDLKKSAEESVTFDQKGCRFIPHALLARTDQTVRVLSDDPILHNTHTYPLKNKSENTAIKANDRDGVAMKHPVPETLPLQVKCDIHPWMKAYWLILDHPYAAVTDEQGKFKIENLPVGTHEFVVWQELPGYVERKLKVTIEAGKQTDLGTIKVPATKFKG